ncbi:uncharacterized protein BJX67DRAFT_76257 [Aspergillus lucknowensis]|uniref:F-box domain-containing protein n=1 Tax=Aspergillus lucknowensis TaxID=176173 RepID=A0ABR4LWH4_9EURO
MPSPEQSALPEPSPLLELPSELLVLVFQWAPSFEAAAALSVTCRQLYEVWKQHSTPIYNQIALATIPCYPEIRNLLADLRELPTDAEILTPENITRVVEISRIGDELVKEYEIVVDNNPSQDPQVPRRLSPTEKLRFIRAQYQILGLLSLNTHQDKLQRIKSMDLKTLFLLSDFLCVYSTETIQVQPLRYTLDADPWAFKRLQGELRAHRNREFQRLYNERYYPMAVTPYEQGGRHAWWCDCQQEVFRRMVTGRVYSKEEKNSAGTSAVRDEIWYDSAEEE